MRRFLLVFIATLVTAVSQAQTGISDPNTASIDNVVTQFMNTWNINGGAVAISKDGKLVYNKAFGSADQNLTQATQPYNLFRIASVSKPITGMAMMMLIQNGLVGIDDTVFGAGKILDQSYYLSSISDNRIYNITVRHLLEHTGGWDRDIPCDSFTHCDPISFPLHVTNALSEPNPVGDSTLIKFLIAKGLQHDPGTVYAYSNIGYLVLGKIIERLSGMSYEDYVSTSLLQPYGLCDVHLGKNLLADKQEREVEYNDIYTTLSAYGTGQTVPWQYGGWNLEAMNAHGGWIATSADLVKLILGVDDFNSVPDVLSPSSVQLMIEPSDVGSGYAKGWSVNSFGNWWHTGSLDGSSAFMARTSGGYVWAFLFNERSNSGSYWNAMDQLPWDALASVSNFPTYDLFPPVTNVSNITTTLVNDSTVILNWTNGDGDGRVVLAAENQLVNAYPTDGTDYNANADFGSGQSVGNAFVVYAGNGNSVTVTGLQPGHAYEFTAYEYNKSTTTGNHTVYKYGCNPRIQFPFATNVYAFEDASPIRFVQTGNVVSCYFTNFAGDFTVCDVLGREIIRRNVRVTDNRIDFTDLPNGLLLYKATAVNGRSHQGKIRID